MTDDEYNKKLENLQQFTPFLNSVIDQLKDSQSKQREPQLTKMLSLYSMITDRKRKLKMKTLLKCEEVILKLYDKSKFGAKNLSPSSTKTTSTKQISDGKLSQPSDSSSYSEAGMDNCKKPDVINVENLKKKAELLKASQNLSVRSVSTAKSVSFSLAKPVKKLASGPQLEAFQDDSEELTNSEEKLPKQEKPVLSSTDNKILESSKHKERRNSISNRKDYERRSESSSHKKTDRKNSTEHRHRERKEKTRYEWTDRKNTERKDEKRDNTKHETSDKKNGTEDKHTERKDDRRDNTKYESSKKEETIGKKNGTDHKHTERKDERRDNTKHESSKKEETTDKKSGIEHKHTERKDKDNTKHESKKDKDDKPKRLEQKKPTPPPTFVKSMTPPLPPSISSNISTKELVSSNVTTLSQHNGAPPILNFVKPQAPPLLSVTATRETVSSNITLTHPILDYVQSQPPPPPLIHNPLLSIDSTKETTSNNITLSHPILDFIQSQPTPSIYSHIPVINSSNNIQATPPLLNFLATNMIFQGNLLNFPHNQTTLKQPLPEPQVVQGKKTKKRKHRLSKRQRARLRAMSEERKERERTFSSTLDSSQKESENNKVPPSQSNFSSPPYSFNKSKKSQIMSHNNKLPPSESKSHTNKITEKEPKPCTSTAKESEDLVSSSVSSSSECRCKKNEVAVGEISSTIDVQEKSEDQSEVTRFFMELLKDERTKAITSTFINQISKSTNEKIKMVVDKVRPIRKDLLIRRKTKLRAQLLKMKRLKREKCAKFRRKLEDKKVTDEKIKKKKAKPRTELELLHKDINDMFIRDEVLTATGPRNCRLSKTPPVPNNLDPKTISPEELKEMTNVRVLLPKLPIDKLNKRGQKRPKTWSDVPKAKRTKVIEEERRIVAPDINYSWNFKSPCKLCPFFGHNITNHYRTKHPDSEVFSSRLRPDKAESAIKHSLEFNLDGQKDVAEVLTRHYAFKCRFCDIEINSRLSRCYDHVTTHTGEYRHLCTLCTFAVSTHKPLKKHYVNVHNGIELPKLGRVCTKIYGYICRECNFVQMSKEAVEKHVDVYHSEAKIIKIHLSAYDDLTTGKAIGTQVDVTSSEVVEARSSTDNEVINDQNGEERTETTESPGEENQSKRVTTEESAVVEETRSSTDGMVIDEGQNDSEERTETTEPTGEENEEPASKRITRVEENDEETRSSTDNEMVIDEGQSEQQTETTEPPSEENGPLSKRIKTEESPVVERNENNVVGPLLQPIKTEVVEPPIGEKEPSDQLVEVKPEPQSDVVQSDESTVSLDGLEPDMVQRDEPMTSLNNPPPLSPLVQKPQKYTSNTIRAGYLNIYKFEDGVKYECRVPSCLFSTKLRECFVTHWEEDHSRFNGCYKVTTCKVCHFEVTSTLDSPLLSEFFAHVVSKHLDHETTTPALRIRRLSGDKLSKKDEENENHLGIQISGIVSLAGEKQEEVTGPETETSPSMERVVLKEFKLSKVEKEAKWKSNEAMKMFLQCPRALYKCPQFFCKFSTSLKAVFDHHITTHGPSKEHLVCCVYCDVKTPLNQASLHIDLRHSNCLYLCTKCLYRALKLEYLMVHMKTNHSEGDTIVVLPSKPTPTATHSKQKKFAVKKACPPYKCGHKSCAAQFLFTDEYYNHVMTHHGGLMCCGYEKKEESVYKFVNIESLIEHYKGHNCYPLHCLLCKKGTLDLYTMLEHYSVRHPNMSPEVVNRRNGPKEEHNYYEDQAFEKVRYVPHDVILSTVSGKKFIIVPADDLVESPVTGQNIIPSAETNKKVIPSAETSNKLIPSTETSKKVIPSAESSNKIIPSAKTSKKTIPLAETSKKVVSSAETSNNIIPSAKTSKKVIPLSETSKKVIPSAETSKKVVPSPETSTKVMAIIPEVDPLCLETDDSGIERLGLTGSELYRCAFCTQTLSNETAFKQHYRSKNCHDPNDVTRPFKCVHCGGKFKSLIGLNLHLQYHGRVRFHCSICNKRYPWLYQLKLHMKYHHDVKNMKTVPLVSNKTDIDNDEFAVAPIENMAEHAFHPYQIDDLPKDCVFRSPLKCALCSYSSKIRSDLIRHLQLHSSELTEVTPMFLICLDKNAWQK